MESILQQGKANILLDGQFGSTGKGSFAAFIATKEHIDIAVSNAAPNAGHTAIVGSKTIITKHLPISGVINNIPIYLNAGARINPRILLEECTKYNVDKSLITIHPRACVIDESCIAAEKDPNSSETKIASTQSGVGEASTQKIHRYPNAVAENSDILKSNFNIAKIDLNSEIISGKTILIEMPQGYDLGINEGFSYPYCTSHSITVPQALADANVHPNNFGNAILTMRTHPIRVGNLIDENNIEIGNSGPFYPDSEELSWADLNLKQEYTTNTKRIRRIATFSYQQYKRVTAEVLPTTIFLNFANYCSEKYLDNLVQNMLNIYKPEQLYLGYGPAITDIKLLEKP